ncbi:MAG: four-carbon acid sugar kinase family protein [Nitrospinae bacterium]|nr:four-carbon acid sugar kinase family protein [Nitrospinota bacterium]
MPILIVADDLTGAADCAAPFRQAGLSAAVLTTSHACHIAADRFQVISFSLHTREASRAGVRRIWARNASAIGVLAQNALVYQKIDSTLRGHPALEVRLLRDLLGAPAAMIAPAFPKQGRQTIDGEHRVQGVPLADTEYAHAWGRRQASSRLPEMFAYAREPLPSHLSWGVIERGVEVVVTWLQEHLAAACRLITADAAHERHLDTLTQAVLSLGSRLLLVGSAGWAERLALSPFSQTLACSLPLSAPPAPPLPPGEGRGEGGSGPSTHPRPGVLGVVGSLSSIATRQVQAAVAEGVAVVPFSMSLYRSVQHPTSTSVAWPSLAQEISGGRYGILWTTPPDGNPTSRKEGQRLLRGLGSLVRAILSATPVSGLVIVGGDTAQAVLRALRASGLTLDGQVAAGIPYGRLLDGPFAGVPVVTKAGGFGEVTTLWHCLTFLRYRVSREGNPQG